jgi:F-type H+-transporting ATPase subunit b
MGENMNSATDLINLLNNWHLAPGFGFNTNPLETNLINLAIVIGVLVYFGKKMFSDLLNNRRDTIFSTIRNAEERYQEAINNLNQARTRLQQAQTKADKIRINGLSQIQKEEQQLIREVVENSRRVEDSKNMTILLEEQSAIEQVLQQVSKLMFKKALNALNSRLNVLDSGLNVRLQTRVIDSNLVLLKVKL